MLNIIQQPKREKNLQEMSYMYMYNWVTLLYTWNYHNIANQPKSNIK